MIADNVLVLRERTVLIADKFEAADPIGVCDEMNVVNTEAGGVTGNVVDELDRAADVDRTVDDVYFSCGETFDIDEDARKAVNKLDRPVNIDTTATYAVFVCGGTFEVDDNAGKVADELDRVGNDDFTVDDLVFTFVKTSVDGEDAIKVVDDFDRFAGVVNPTGIGVIEAWADELSNLDPRTSTEADVVVLEAPIDRTEVEELDVPCNVVVVETGYPPLSAYMVTGPDVEE